MFREGCIQIRGLTRVTLDTMPFVMLKLSPPTGYPTTAIGLCGGAEKRDQAGHSSIDLKGGVEKDQ